MQGPDDSLLMALSDDFHYSIPAQMNGGKALAGRLLHDFGLDMASCYIRPRVLIGFVPNIVDW